MRKYTNKNVVYKTLFRTKCKIIHKYSDIIFIHRRQHFIDIIFKPLIIIMCVRIKIIHN